ncbi:PD-(D/E)XK nuclease family protein [Eubacteriales bacterium KG127]
MINVFYGRENLNREQFIYDKIFNGRRPAIVIVPDQYGLEAEKQALRYAAEHQSLRGSCGETTGTYITSEAISLLDVDILSFSRLANLLLSEQGGLKTVFVDRAGREIIIAKVLRQIDYKTFKVFGSQIKSKNFASMVGDFISQMKLENVTSKQLIALSLELEEKDQVISSKLHDMGMILEAYEEELKGKFTDSEDYISFVTDKIATSEKLSGKDFWFYGFDSFSGRLYEMISALSNKAKSDAMKAELNFVLSHERGDRENLFKAGEQIIFKLREIASLIDDEIFINRIDDQYLIEKFSDLAKLEEGLFALNPKKYQGECKNIKIIKSANVFNEAESCASHIRYLMREKGYRMRDMVIICNDEGKRISLLKRIFKDYDLQLFIDDRKPVTHDSFVRYILSCLKVVTSKFSSFHVINAIKNPYSELETDGEESDKLENYAIRYKIRGSMWKLPFKYGEADRKNPVDLTELNLMREKAMEPFIKLEEVINECKKNNNSMAEFASKYFDFVEKIAISGQIEDGPLWKGILGVLDQLVNLIGEEAFDPEIFLESLEVGFEALKIGELPSSIDDLLLGSMQRTRTAPVKAVLVIGMNEGLIPKSSKDEGIFSSYEISRIEDTASENGKGFGAKWKNLQNEENLAIYRNLCKATEELWISYIVSDIKGDKQLPSELVGEIKAMYEDDIEDLDEITKAGYIVETPKSTLIHLAKAYATRNKNVNLPEALAAGEEWLSRQELSYSKDAEAIKKIRNFIYEPEVLSPELVKSLYSNGGESIGLSPSKLEQFSRCPYKYFVNYGIKPIEEEIAGFKGNDVGTFIHKIMEDFGRWADENSLWGEMSDSLVEDKIDSIVKDYLENEVEKNFPIDGEARYITARLKALASRVCKELRDFRNESKVSKSSYEVKFKLSFPKEILKGEIGEYNFEDMPDIRIKGIVDRVDFVETPDGEFFTVVDYKTGQDQFSEKLVREGYSLQLFTYINAIENQYGDWEEAPEGVGVFYVKVRDEIDEKGPRPKEFQFDGTTIEIVAENIGKEYIKKKGRKKENESIIDQKTFNELKGIIKEKLESLCREILMGDVSISPMKIDENNDPCKYCDYGDICRYNSALKKVTCG